MQNTVYQCLHCDVIAHIYILQKCYPICGPSCRCLYYRGPVIIEKYSQYRQQVSTYGLEGYLFFFNVDYAKLIPSLTTRELSCSFVYTYIRQIKIRRGSRRRRRRRRKRRRGRRSRKIMSEIKKATVVIKDTS